jgi:2-oxoglutarate ferredoxin oxidoreductase subunit alpha
MVMGDGMIGQMMEPVEFPEMRALDSLPAKPWAANGCRGRGPNIINSLYLNEYELNDHNFDLKAKYDEMERVEKRFETWGCEEPVEVLVVAYGTMARIVKTALAEFREEGGSAGLFRPITLWPYPREALGKAARRAKRLLVVEMSTGQMIDDVRLSTGLNKRLDFFGKTGGVVPSPDDVLGELRRIAGSAKKAGAKS